MNEVSWSSQPPSTKRQPTLSLKRTQNGKVLGICLSSKPIGCCTHFYRGRTRPCTGDNACEPCKDGHSWRWKGYVAMYNDTTREIWIHEFTEYAYNGIAEGLEAFKDLRGHWIKFERARSNANAPVNCTVAPTKVDSQRLPEEPDIVDTLYRIWDLTKPTAAAEINQGAFHDQIRPRVKTA